MYSSHGEIVHHHRAECVEDDLESGEEGLPQDGVKEEGFKSGRKIRVKPVDSQGFVMCQVIWAKCSAVGQSYREICEDGQ